MRGLEAVQNPGESGFGLLQNLIVGHTHNAQSLSRQLELAISVGLSAGGIVVNRAINFNDHSCRVAIEIDGVGADGVLATNLVVGEATVSQKAP
ncbi:MAG: hypothetical protein AAF170_19830 [Bacteroidota bacterium]